MKILILGGEGMLGHKMLQAMRGRFQEVTCTIQGQREDSFYRRVGLFDQGPLVAGFDAMDTPTLRRRLAELQPEVVINCIGVIKQRREASAAIPSITLNALMPHLLAEQVSAWGGRVIHFSTDCVFDGRRGGYTEADPSDAEDLYGKTKHLGEVAGANALTLRTSIIGRELRQLQSLLEWFLAQRGKTVRGFTRHLYSGVTTNYLAELVADLIERHPHLSGLYQVTGETITKHDLLCQLRDAYQLDVEIVPDEGTSCDRSMIGDRFRQATNTTCPPWPRLVAQLASDPTPYEKWR